MVKLRVRDVCHRGGMASPAIVLQQKTQRPGQFEITEPTREAVSARISHAGLTAEHSLFPSGICGSAHLCTRQYARIVNSCVQQLGLDRADYGTHTLRRTKATLIYRVRRIFGPSSCCSGTRSWKAQSATLGSRSTTLSKWRSQV